MAEKKLEAKLGDKPELLEIYDLNGKFLCVKERKKLYSEIRKEFAETGKITKQVRGIRLLLLNSSGRIYLQKRAKHKKENPGLYDKTVGGHVSAGTSYDMTLVKECSEELGFPAAVLPATEFSTAVNSVDLTIVGIFKQIDYITPFMSTRISKDGTKFIQPWMNAFYIGYYNGAIRFADGESSGIQVYSLDELKEELEEKPDEFTEDIKFMVNTYEPYLVPLK